ncbi:MAG TPA: efflux RND transporter periplasmic adaptor subunit, partial [Agriterribacter sp.]|nr:efflux RND transporter periplasmic adaptor subunit [Agriterribacter sp.]
IPANLDAAILVPQKSTYEIQGKQFVYLLDSAGTVKSVEIRIRENTGGQYFVVEEGLQPGDKIILEGVATLREGAPVIAREVSADSVFSRNGTEIGR